MERRERERERERERIFPLQQDFLLPSNEKQREKVEIQLECIIANVSAIKTGGKEL